MTHEARIDGRAPTWSRIAMAGVVLLVLKFSLSHVVDPWRYTGDARQHVFWTYRFADPELFPDDLMVEFISTFRFDPPGFQAAYAVGARAMDALLFSKLLGALLCLVSGALAWDVGRRAAGPRAGALCALLVGALVFDNMRYALPRAFAFPAVLMMLQALQAKSPLRASVAILAAGLFYPALLPVFGTACGVRLLIRRRRGERRGNVILVATIVGVAGLVLWTHVLSDPEVAGPFVTRTQSLAMPEFQSDGRDPYWDEDPVVYWLGNWGNDPSACGLLSLNIFVPFWICLLTLAWRRREFRWMGGPGLLFGAGLAWFLLAHLLLFRLYVPARQTMYVWPMALAILAGVNLAPVLERPLEFARTLLGGWRGATAFALAALIIVSIVIERGPRAPDAERQSLFAAIRALPKDVVIAGIPKDLDDIPLFTKRSVFMNEELSVAWYTSYHKHVRARIRGTLDLLFAGQPADVRAHARRLGITHVLVNKRVLRADPSDTRGLMNPPYHEDLAALLRRGPPALLDPAAAFTVLYDGPDFALVGLEESGR